ELEAAAAVKRLLEASGRRSQRSAARNYQRIDAAASATMPQQPQEIPFVDAPRGCSEQNRTVDFVDHATGLTILSKIPRWIPVINPHPPFEFVGCVPAALEFPEVDNGAAL